VAEYFAEKAINLPKQSKLKVHLTANKYFGAQKEHDKFLGGYYQGLLQREVGITRALPRPPSLSRKPWYYRRVHMDMLSAQSTSSAQTSAWSYDLLPGLSRE